MVSHAPQRDQSRCEWSGGRSHAYALTSTRGSTSCSQAGSHIDLRKRNAAFQAKIGKTNSLKTVDPVERKPVPKWIIYTFLFLIVGGCTWNFLSPLL
jgi:hypothetical protein